MVGIAASALGLASYVTFIGSVVLWVRLSAAHLPADVTLSLLDARLLVTVGVKAVAVAALVVGVLVVIAYVASLPRWGEQKAEWAGAIHAGGPLDPSKASGEHPEAGRMVQLVSGINVVALAGVVTLGLVSAVEGLFSSQVLAVGALVVFVVVATLASRFSLRLLGSKRRIAAAVVVCVAALFCEVPIALLMLTLAAATFAAPAIARIPPPSGGIAGTLRSPWPWVLGTVYLVVAFGFVAVPPVSYSRASVITTDAGVQTGGYLATTGDGVYLARCLGKSDARSETERVSLVKADRIKDLSVGGEPYRFDSGDRPALVTVALRTLGIDWSPPIVPRVELRAEKPVCDSVERAEGGPDQGLGPGVLADPQPNRQPGARAEPTVSQAPTNPALARLARRYQPTVETTVADRFWPASVTSVLAERGSNGRHVCLVAGDRCARRRPRLTDLRRDGSPDDYLDLPAKLRGDPEDQFLAFTRGQGVRDAVAREILTAPASIDPWASATVYFYYAGRVRPAGRYQALPPGLIGLQYWFFYPYNAYPLKPKRGLMDTNPLAAAPARLNTDLHEGDWEHVTVLLDAKTHAPRFLYLARHDQEAEILGWGDPALAFDGDHPIVQAAFGGHPSYDSHCSERKRAFTRNALSDWVVCGGGRYGFRAASTPLVDLARASWACWPGHFGEATAAQRRALARSKRDPRRLYSSLVKVAGPRSPLRQAENARACDRDPLEPERSQPIRG